MAKKLIIETEDNGWDRFLGEKVEIWCLNFFYTGTLVVVNDTFIELGADARVIYETGKLGETYKNALPLNRDSWRVRLSAVESYGPAVD